MTLPPSTNELQVLDIVFPLDFIGNAVDVGANDGKFLSLTAHLEQRGWRVLCVEPNKHYEEALTACRKDVALVAAGAEDSDSAPFSLVESAHNVYAAASSLHPNPYYNVAKVIDVPVRRLDRLLAEHNFTSIDLLQIDVEGTEVDVLTGFDISRWLPRCIILENWEPGDGKFDTILKPHGYSLMHLFQFNEIYTRGEK